MKDSNLNMLAPGQMVTGDPNASRSVSLRIMAQKKSKNDGEKVIAKNPNAGRNYILHDRFEAGLVLLGTEVKAAREGSVNLKEAFVTIRGEEAFLANCHIGAYSNAGYSGHEPTRERKLLLHKRELSKLHGQLTLKGYTLVPLRLYTKNGRLKIEIALAQGKNTRDKRQETGEKDARKEIRRAMESR